MSTTRAAVGSRVDVSLLIQAPPGVVLKAFFDADAIGAWWQAVRSVTTPRALGAYAIEWRPTDFSDELLGRLGGVFRGTVVQFEGKRSFFVADAYWLPPDGEPIGPMALEVAVTPSGDSATVVRVRQTGFEESPRWRRYYEVVGVGWERALRSMKILLEK
jgi:uncharacterized protein YndB with AHSA1/START domain